MSCEKMGFYLQGQGHSVGLYNQNMTISTIIIVQELCESRGDRPELSFIMSLLVSVDVKNY